MKKHITNLINAEKLQKKPGFKTIGKFLALHPFLFSLQRKKSALGFSIAIAFSVIPLPIQFFLSCVFCYFFKASIPAAFLATLCTNPLTLPLIFAMAFNIGKFFHAGDKITNVSMPSIELLIKEPNAWFNELVEKFDSIGVLLMTGLPFTGIILGLCSYCMVRFGWYWIIVIKWKHRAKNRK